MKLKTILNPLVDDFCDEGGLSLELEAALYQRVAGSIAHELHYKMIDKLDLLYTLRQIEELLCA